MVTRIQSEDPEAPSVGAAQALETFDDSGLARSVGTEDAEDLAALHLEAHILDGYQGAVSLLEMLDDNHRLRPAHGRRVYAIRPEALQPTGRIAGALITAFMVVVFGGLLYLKAWPPIVVVMSSSMEPAIDTGAIVLMKQLEGPPSVGDVVAVPVPAEARESGYPEEVLHRVIEVTEDGLVRTQGDNLDKPDPFAVPARRRSVSTWATPVFR